MEVNKELLRKNDIKGGTHCPTSIRTKIDLEWLIRIVDEASNARTPGEEELKVRSS